MQLSYPVSNTLYVHFNVHAINISGYALQMLSLVSFRITHVGALGAGDLFWNELGSACS